MNRKFTALALLGLLATGTNTALACEFKIGETKYLDYANCRYGTESIQVVELKDHASWDQCVYYLQAFRPGKLLAVVKDQDGKELLSINDRSKIGNPCYMTKSRCDAALKTWEQSSY
jgi:hypothetical protein